MAGDGAERQGESPPWPRVGPAAAQPVFRPVVFVLPGLGGEEDPELEKIWGPARAVLDLVPIAYLDWTDLVERGCDFRAIAEHVRRQIEAKVPSGPIRMAGYSIGGHLAYATAVGFQAAGRPMGCVAILDAPLSVSHFVPSLPQRLRGRFRQVLSFDPGAALSSLISKCLVMDRSRPLLRRFARYRRVRLPFGFDVHLHHKITMQLVRRIYAAWWDGVLGNAPPLDAPVWLFRSEEHEAYEQHDLGWAAYCPNLKVVPVAGSHRGMLDSSINGPLREAFVAAMTTAEG
jgi:thioesterase domain-containing protein